MRDNHKKEKRGMDQHDDAGADGIIGQDITDRRSAEDALRQAEQKYRDIFENAGEGISQTTPEGRFIAANPALARMYGFDSPEELIGSLSDISRQVYVDPARREEFKSLLEEHGVVRGFEYQIFRKDGSKIWVSVNARAVHDALGAILYYEGTTQDINERKRAEARSAAFATLARKLSGARTQLDAGRIIAETAADLFGWDSCCLDLYDAERDLVHPMLNVDTIAGKRTDVTAFISDQEPTLRSKRVIAHGPELLLREEPIQFDEDAIPFGDKSRPSASIMTVPIRHAAKVIGLLSIQSYTVRSYDAVALADLEALADHCGAALNRIRAEESLRESEERYRELFENAKDVIYVHDLSGRYISVNRAAEKLSGYTREEILGKHYSNFVAPSNLQYVRKNLSEKVDEESETIYEVLVITKDRRRVPVELSSRLIYENGVVVAVQGTARDITERKRAENALQESEERFRQLSEAPFEAIILHDQGTILEVNQSFCRLYGYERAEVIGKSVLDLTPAEFREPLLQRVRSGGTDPFEGLALRKDGTLFMAELAAKPIHYQGRSVRVAAIRDITEQKRNERRQAAQYAVTRVLAESVTVAEATPQLLQVICESLRWKMGEFWRVGDSPNFLRCVETWHVPGLDASSFIEASRQTELAPGDGLPGRVWQSGQPAWIPDVMTDPRFARAAIAGNLGLRGAVAFPILLENHTLGVMLFFSRRSPEVDEDLLKMMSAIGSQIGQFTERKRAEAALQESERRLREMLENVELIAVILDVERRVAFCNDHLLRLTGRQRADVLGQNWFALFVPPEQHVEDVFTATIEQGTVPAHFENDILTAAGERRWIAWNNTVLRDIEGRAIGTTSIGEDITERRRAEGALRESEERYRDLVENSRELICTHDLDGLVLSANPAAVAALGYDLDEYVGKKTIRDLLAPEVSNQFDEYMTRLRKEGTTSGIMLVQTRSGERRVWEYYNSLRTEGVAAPIVRGMARDITDRMRAEAMLASEKRVLEMIATGASLPDLLETLVREIERQSKGLSCSILLLDAGGVHLRHGAAPSLPDAYCRAIDGVSIGPSVGSCGTAAFRKEPVVVEDIATDPLWEDYRDLALEHGLRACWSTPILTAGGSVLGTFAMYYRESRQPGPRELELIARATQMAAIAIERRQAEQAVSESERRYHDIFTFAPVGIYQSLRDGSLITANQALAEMLAYDSVDELLKVNLAEVYFTPDEREKLIREYEGLGYAIDIELQWKRKDGAPLWVQMSAHAIKGTDGLTKYFEGFVRDITDHKRAEMERDVISEVIQSVNLTANLDELLAQVHQSLKRVLYAENCCVALYDQQTGLLEAPFFVDLLEANPFPMALSKNCTAKVFSSGQPLLMNEAIFAELLDRGEVELIGRPAPSYLAVPLMTPAETIGVIVVQHYEKENVYSQRDVEFLSAVAAQLARAIERKRAEEALTESDRRFRDLFYDAPVGYHELDTEGRITCVNTTELLMLGYSAEEMLGHYAWEFIVDQEISRRAVADKLAGITPLGPLERSFRRKDGTSFHGQVDERLLHDPAGRIIGIRTTVQDITERKQQEEALHESETLLKQSQRVAVLGHYVFDVATGFWTSSDVLDEIFGIDVAYTKNAEGWLSIVHPEERNEMYAYLRDHVLKERNSFDREYRIVRINDSAVRWVHGLGNLEFNTEGQPARVFGVIQDITERKLIAEALHESEERYRDLVENSREFICTHDLNGIILSANRAASEVLGYDLRDYCGKRNFRELLVPEVRDQFDEYLTRICKNGVASGLTLVQTSSGERRILEYYNTLRTVGVATPIVRGMARDITEQRRAEKVMSDLRHELELTMNTMEEGVHRVDLKGNIVFENPAAARMLGWEVDELLGKPAHLTMHHTKQDGTPYPTDECPIYATFRDGVSRQVADEVFWRQDGTSFPVEYLTAPMRGDRNEIVATVVTFRDITERKHAEEALRQSEERYRELFENAKDAIYVHDLSGRYTSVNRAGERLTGFSREQILGKHYSNFVSPRDLKQVRTSLCRKLDEENETIYEVNVITRTGQRVPVEISSRLIYENGVVAGVQGTARDITERKRAQEALRIYSQRLIQAQEAEREKIARELHDEIGQVLTAVRINLQSIQRSRGTGEGVRPLDESIAIVDEALGRVRELSIELRPSLLDDLGLSAALRWYVDRYAQRTGIIAEVLDGFKEDGRLTRELETACFRIAQEALTNVARHAQAGSVSVQLERRRERMLLTIIDDGVGFDVDKLRKSASVASALGLRGMEERALALGGRLEIDSGLERGTRILATFPLKRK